MQKAVLAAGCFWCYEPIFKSLKGVKNVILGYSGGNIGYPTYLEVSSGDTGFAESVLVEFDDTEITYRTLLDVFFAIHDPTTLNRQGNDSGTQYRSAIFYIDDDQKNIAEEKVRELDNNKEFDSPIVTEVTKFKNFYPAEQYHQNFFANNPSHPYCQRIITPKIKKFREKFKSFII